MGTISLARTCGSGILIFLATAGGDCDGNRPVNHPPTTTAPPPPPAVAVIAPKASPPAPEPVASHTLAVDVIQESQLKIWRVEEQLTVAKRKLDEAKKAAASRLAASPNYAKAKAAADAAMAKLEGMRIRGEMESRLEASSDANKKAAIVKKMETDHLVKDADVSARVEEVARLEKEYVLAKSDAEAIAGRERRRQEAASAVPQQAMTPQKTPQPSASVGTGGTNVGPRGGVYHYSKSGKKVYEKRH